MTAAIYARVSTTDQNCEMQVTELRDYLQRRGWMIAGEYVDTGWSGSKASRPQLDRLMKDAGEHRFDAIAVWKLDRFGRSVLNLSQQLNQLRAWGVRFLAVTQSIDTDAANPSSALLLHILAAVAEFEREMIRERVKSGLAAAKRRGVRCGRPKLVCDSARIGEMRERGMSVRQIAAKLKLSRTSVHRTILGQVLVVPKP